MKLIYKAITLGLLSLTAAFSGCKSETQTVQPQARGQRGESCQARNDCQSGLACVNALCVKNEFDISAEAKQCDIVQCEETADCCGGKPTEAPAKCGNRTSVCATPTLPGCTATSCSGDTDCDSGVCGAGVCSNTSVTCTSDAQCAAPVDSCDLDAGFCLYSYTTACDGDEDCVAEDGTCEARSCSCTNPEYDPLDPICSDPDCVDVCTLVCDDERCVADESCEADADCGILAPLCHEGSCVACVEDADCDEDNEESCIANVCKKPCTTNEECPLFHECDEGECVESGCTSDRECVLALGGTASILEDPRLAECLPSDEDPEIGACKIPCENDASCGQLQVCDGGYCKFVGCESDEECRAYYRLENQASNDTMPYISRAVCRE